jgi:hypothetical protein
MLLEGSSPLGVFSRILLGSSHWASSGEYCYVWERLDTRFGCSAFQLTPLGQSTDGSGSLLLPTPTVQDGANNAGPSQMERNSLSLNATFGGSLNPRFVEQLQGFLIDHTALKRSAMPASRSRPIPSLEQYG